MTDVIHETLASREQVHGRFETHAEIAQRLKLAMWECETWINLTPVQKEALEMIQHKIARVLNGNPNFPDHWLDVAGYSMLVHDRLEGEQCK